MTGEIMQRKSVPGIILLVIAYACVVMALTLSGCSTKSKVSDGPDDIVTGVDDIVVSASPGTLTAGVSSVIEALVLNEGVPVEGVAITFSTSPALGGQLSPTVDTSDAEGVAATVFTPAIAGDITITAATADGLITGTVVVESEVVQQPDGDGFVWVTAEDSVLFADGGDNTVIRIEVRDSLGNAAPLGTTVTLVAGEQFIDGDEDGVYTVGDDQLVIDANNNGWWDSFGTIPATATTDAEGVATVTYTSGTDMYDVYIKASVHEGGIATSYDLKISVLPETAVHSIYLASDSIQLVVTQTGGIESAFLTATAYDIYGYTVPAGYPISFQIIDGPGGGEHLIDNVVGYGPYATVTDENGQARVPVSSGTVSGTMRLRAVSGAVLSNATQVLIAAGPPYAIWIGADTCNIAAWGIVNEENRLVAIVSDMYNNPVNDSTVVYWSCDEGVVKATEARTGDHNGTTSTGWLSTGPYPGGDGVVVYWAETAGGTVADTAMFLNTWFADTVIVTGVPATMPLDGSTEVMVWVTAEDFHSLPVVAGSKFEADANYITVNGGTFEDGCGVAWARSTLKSTVLEQDYSTPGGNDDGIGAVETVEFWAGYAVASTFNINLLTGNAFAGNCSITGVTNASPGEVVDLSAIVKDRAGNPLGDHTLNMTASAGVVTNGTQETNSYGEASGFRWTAPGGEGDFTITITDTDPRGSITFSKKITVAL